MALMKVNKSFDIFITREQLEEYLHDAGIKEGFLMAHQHVQIRDIDIQRETLTLTVDATVFQQEDA